MRTKFSSPFRDQVFPGELTETRWKNKDTLWRQYCVPSAAKTWKHCSDTRNFFEDFQKLFVARHKCRARGKTSRHLGNMITSEMSPPQCVLVLPALTLKLFEIIVNSLEHHFELFHTHFFYLDSFANLVLDWSRRWGRKSGERNRRRGTKWRSWRCGRDPWGSSFWIGSH